MAARKGEEVMNVNANIKRTLERRRSEMLEHKYEDDDMDN